MSIRARLNNENVHTFDCDDELWFDLKENHKKIDILMPCCDSHAVPKNSKLNTKFFSHSKKGECLTAPESAEHIYLKTLISEIAIENGWEVTAEKRGETPSGEVWIADVYCTKGNDKLAFEVQWSTQTSDEFTRRTNKYIESGIKCIWLYRKRSNTKYKKQNGKIYYDKNRPIFDFIRDEKTKYLFVIPHRIHIDSLIESFIRNEIKDLIPVDYIDDIENIEKIIVKVTHGKVRCWKCRKESNFVHRLSFLLYGRFQFWDTYPFEPINRELILKYIGNKKLATFNISPIKKRHNKSEGYNLSGACFHCGRVDSYTHKNKTQESESLYSFKIDKETYDRCKDS